MKLAEEEVLEFRRNHRGLIGVGSKVAVRDSYMLSLVYTPGVAESCLEIAQDIATSFDYTWRGNTVAILSDGSNILDAGNVGPQAATPLLETKAVIFRNFAGVDGVPLCLDSQETAAIVKAGRLLEPTFGGIVLTGLAAPKCFEIKEQLQAAVGVPVYHDDEQGAAVVTLAGLINALKVVGKSLANARIVISCAGPAGHGVANLLAKAGAKDVVVCDTEGAIYQGRPGTPLNRFKADVASRTNLAGRKGSLAEVLKGADVYIGFTANAAITAEMIQTMAAEAIVFALATPNPEIAPNAASAAGAGVVATVSTDYANCLDTALVYPGLIRGLLDVRASKVNEDMLIAVAGALAGMVSDSKLAANSIVPDVLDLNVAPVIAEAVAKAAQETGVAGLPTAPAEVAKKTRAYLYEGQFAPPRREPIKGGLGPQKVEAINLRKRFGGVLEVRSKLRAMDRDIFASFCLAPGNAVAVKALLDNPEAVFNYTARSNMVAVVSDGSAVLGLGNIGGAAGLPVMEGKGILFNTFAGVESLPICLATQDPDEIVELVKLIGPSFGGINLEDISAPRCFEIEQRLKKEMSIPVFHDDQHGTAVVVLAGMLNAFKLLGRDLGSAKMVMNGAGSAGVAVSKLLLAAGVKNLIMCDTKGAIYKGRPSGMNWIKEEMAEITNPEGLKGSLEEVIKGADVFLGVSKGGAVTPEMVRTMAKDPVIFAMANPVPEIMPDVAQEAGAKVTATGRSDFHNQVNNCLAFPGIFRGALDVKATDINEEMKVAAANAIASLVADKDLTPSYVIPAAMDFRVSPKVAAAVAQAAMDSGVARLTVDPALIEANTISAIYEGQVGELPS